MSTTAKRRGSTFELDVLKYLRANNFDAERLRLAGRDDEGDLVVKDGGVVILECKATRRLDTSTGVKEAMVEKVNYAKARGLDPEVVTGVMVWKVPGKPIGQSLVILPLDEFFDIDGSAVA